MTQKWPKVRKESTYWLTASHDLFGYTSHPDALIGVHVHQWEITLIFVSEFNPSIGFIHDEHGSDKLWGKRIQELDGKNLSELMFLPASAENFALWLMYRWLPRLSPREINFELSGIRVKKGSHASEIMHTEATRNAWIAFGGEVA